MTYRGAIVDLDGTVYRGGELVPGARSGVERLRTAGLDVLFFSNNPTRDASAYAEYLSERGIDVAPAEALSAGTVTTEYLRANHAEEPVFLVGADGLRRQLSAAGLELTDDPANASVLLASWTESFEYEDLQSALAIDDEATFLGTDPDRTWPAPDGAAQPGSGAIIRSIAGVLDRDPDAILGKPSEQALAAARDHLGVALSESLVVGDRPGTDLAMGERAGMTTVLVLSGSTTRADLATSSVEPDYVIDHLGEIGRVLEDD